MLISNSQKFTQAPFKDEDEIEKVVLDNYPYIFGPGSFLLPKIMIKTNDGAGTIPDAYAIDLVSRKWFIVEVELSRHDVWKHIAPQVSKQIIAAKKESSKKQLLDIAIKLYKDKDFVREIFDDQEIAELDVFRTLKEILETDPIVALPIDSFSSDLKEWALTFKNDVKLWTIKKYIEFNNPGNIIYEFPEEYKPVLDTVEDKTFSDQNDVDQRNEYYDVTILDMLQEDILHVGEKLKMIYKPRNGELKTFEAIIEMDGSVVIDQQLFSSLSDAAVYCIQRAGSHRKTENGWLKWRNSEGELLSNLRDLYFKKKMVKKN